MTQSALSSDVKFDNDNFTFYGDEGVALVKDLLRSIELQSPRADVVRRLRGTRQTSKKQPAAPISSSVGAGK